MGSTSSGRPARPSPSPVVIYRMGSLGDTVVALPSLHRIERFFPDSERIALTNFPINSKASALGAIIGDSGLINRYVAYPVGLRSLSGFVALRKQLRALGASTLVYLTPPRGMRTAWRDVIFFKLCGFKTIIGAPVTADLQYSRVDANSHIEQEVCRLDRCLAELGPIDLQARSSWDLRITDAESRQAHELLAPIAGQPFFAINMGGKLERQDWGIEHWLQLLDRLRQPLSGHALVILGGAEDEPRALQAVERWSGLALSTCGKASPRVSGAAASGARLFVGHDSGPLHLAAAFGLPCVGIFGNNNPPALWHPWGSGHRVIHNMDGVRNIKVDEVAEAVESVLLQSPNAPRRQTAGTS